MRFLRLCISRNTVCVTTTTIFGNYGNLVTVSKKPRSCLIFLVTKVFMYMVTVGNHFGNCSQHA